MAAPLNLNKLQNFQVAKSGTIIADEANQSYVRIDAIATVPSRLDKVAVINTEILADEQDAKAKIVPVQKIGDISIEQGEVEITELAVIIGTPKTINIIVDNDLAMDDLEITNSADEVGTVVIDTGEAYTVTGLTAGTTTLTVKSISKPTIVVKELVITVTEA